MKKKYKNEIVRIKYTGPFIKVDGGMWWVGQGWTATRGDLFYPVQKTESCDRHNANACGTRMPLYGYNNPAEGFVYAVYRCSKHGFSEIRLTSCNQNDIKRYNKKIK